MHLFSDCVYFGDSSLVPQSSEKIIPVFWIMTKWMQMFHLRLMEMLDLVLISVNMLTH